MDPHCFDADPDPAQNLDADPDPYPDPGGGGVGQPKMWIPPWQNLRYAPVVNINFPYNNFYKPWILHFGQR
jgi:hypothetical protein